jgi:hypothetical protein
MLVTHRPALPLNELCALLLSCPVLILLGSSSLQALLCLLLNGEEAPAT